MEKKKKKKVGSDFFPGISVAGTLNYFLIITVFSNRVMVFKKKKEKKKKTCFNILCARCGVCVCVCARTHG